MTNCECQYNKVGQVPGQLYNAQVVDNSGNGLFAGFFYLDADGKQIMSDKFTDNNGYFHFTVPDYNHENIFVQIYATDNYNTVVKSFHELVTEQKIVLTKKLNGVSPVGILAFSALGIALMKNKKQMGKIQMPESIKKLRGKALVTPVLLIGGAALALYYIFKYKPTPAQKQFLEAAKNRLDYLAKELGIVPSLSVAQVATLAAQIARAIDKCGTDEAAIQRAFIALNNEADFWLLAISFGISKYDGCFEGSLPSWNVHYTLPEALASDLSNTDVYALTQILQSKGINITF